MPLFLYLLVGILDPTIIFSQGNEEQKKPPDILIIYSTGTPFKTISDMNTKEVDAVTTPTPVRENCKSIAEKLAIALHDKKFVVKIAEAAEIKDRHEILHARLAVIGSPAYFGNVSWQIKKLLDQQFGQIYVLNKGLDKRRIAAFSIAEIEQSALGAIKAISTVVKDCKGHLGPTMIFLTKHSKKEIAQRINRFADQVAVVAREN